MVIDQIRFVASAIIQNENDEILLLQRSTKSSFSGFWQLPEGKLEEGEKPQEALERELKEEIGVETVSLELLAVKATPLEAKGIKYLAFRIIFNAKIKTNEIKLSNEHINYRWVKKKEVKDMKLLPGILEASQFNLSSE